MTRSVFQLHCSPEEKARWRRHTSNVSGWLKRLAAEECDRLDAEAKDREAEKLKREKIAAVAFPGQERTCDHVASGAFCYRCGRKNF